MDDLNIIDRFTEVFSTYIESGFGLLSGDVAFLVSVLVALDIVLAGLFWALAGGGDVIVQLLRKVLYVGFFALLLNNFAALADIVFDSFAGLGLKAGSAPFGPDQLMKPGFVAETGFTAAWPLLEAAGELVGFTSFFDNIITVLVLLTAWAIVLLAFFILSVQLFITIIEFKLMTLAGFVLVPFGLFGKTAFLAERVLGNVITSGVKLMVLAIVVAIGSTLFGDIAAPLSDEPDLRHAASIILAAIAVFGLAIFVPGIAAGLISGAPQLGAGAAAGTTAGLVGAGIGATAFTSGALRTGGRVGGSAITSAASLAGRTSAGHQAGGASGAAKATLGKPLQDAAQKVTSPIADAYQSGQAEGFRATGSSTPAPPGGRGAGVVSPTTNANGPPEWARQMQRRRRSAKATEAHPETGPTSNPKTEDNQPKKDMKPNGLQTTEKPLRQHTRTCHALSEGGPGLGRAHGRRARPGQELARHGLRMLEPLAHACHGPDLAGQSLKDHAICDRTRGTRANSRRGPGAGALRAKRRADRLSSGRLHRAHPVAFHRPDHRAEELAAGLCICRWARHEHAQ